MTQDRLDPSAAEPKRTRRADRVQRIATVRFTKRGVGALFCGAATTAAGLTLGLTEATSAGLVILAATAASTLSVAARSFRPPPIGIRRVIEQGEGQPAVGDDLAVDVLLDAQRRTALAEMVEVAVDDLAIRKGARSVRMSVRPLRAGETSVAQYRVALRERGLLRFLPLTWRRTDPLGLLRWSYRVDSGATVLVGPAVVPLSDETVRAIERLRPRVASTRFSQPDSFEFRELRTYVPGDDLRRVHWRSSARRNELMIREPERLFDHRPQPIRMTIDARQAMHDGTLELALSIGASIVAALDEPFVVSVRTDGETWHATSAADTTLLLARVDREAAPGARSRRASEEHSDSALSGPTQILVAGPRTNVEREQQVARELLADEANPGALPANSGIVVFAAGGVAFDLRRWEPGEPTRRAVAATIDEVLVAFEASHANDNPAVDRLVNDRRAVEFSS